MLDGSKLEDQLMAVWSRASKAGQAYHRRPRRRGKTQPYAPRDQSDRPAHAIGGQVRCTCGSRQHLASRASSTPHSSALARISSGVKEAPANGESRLRTNAGRSSIAEQTITA